MSTFRAIFTLEPATHTAYRMGSPTVTTPLQFERWNTLFQANLLEDWITGFHHHLFLLIKRHPELFPSATTWIQRLRKSGNLDSEGFQRYVLPGYCLDLGEQITKTPEAFLVPEAYSFDNRPIKALLNEDEGVGSIRLDRCFALLPPVLQAFSLWKWAEITTTLALKAAKDTFGTEESSLQSLRAYRAQHPVTPDPFTDT